MEIHDVIQSKTKNKPQSNNFLFKKNHRSPSSSYTTCMCLPTKETMYSGGGKGINGCQD